MSLSVDLQKTTYMLVTGASRGIGAKMAIECSKKFKPGSLVVLLARSAAGLEVTKSEILAANQSVSVVTASTDLTNPTTEELNEIITKSLATFDKSLFELAFIIHNIGTLGDVSKRAIHLSDAAVWQNYFSINVFSVINLNSQFMSIFAEQKKLIVNITSKAAIVPMKSFAFYCSGKAAREMYFKVLAEEESETIVLNYSPGPVDTDMTRTDVVKSHDNDMQQYFKSIRDDNSMLTTEQTTRKFLDIIKRGAYKSGDHIDYYD